MKLSTERRDEMENASSAELAQRIKDFRFAIRQREKTNRIEQELIDAYQAELDKRFLDDHWAAHPELTPFHVGDKLQVTSMGRKRTTGLTPSLLSIVTVTGLEKGKIVYGQFRCRVPIYVASEMRDAYLEYEKRAINN